MKKFEWNRNLVQKLITLFQEHENLYNRTHSGYINKIERSKSLNEIVKQLKFHDSTITIKDVKSKLKMIRSQYLREYKAVENSKKNATGKDKILVPKLWFYEHLHFLKSHINTRLFTCGVDSEEDLANNMDCGYQESHDESISTETSYHEEVRIGENNSRNKKNDGFTTECSESMLNDVSSSGNTEDDAFVLINEQIYTPKENRNISQRETEQQYSWLGSQVVFEMNKIQSEQIQEECAWSIQKILRKYVQKDRMKRRASTVRFKNNRNNLSTTSDTFPDASSSESSIVNQTIQFESVEIIYPEPKNFSNLSFKGA